QEIETIREVAEAIVTHMDPESIARGLRSGPVPAGNQNREDAPSPARVIGQEEYQFDHLPEYRRLKPTMAQVHPTGTPNPYFPVREGELRDTTRIGWRELISASSDHYRGFSRDPAVSRAAKEAVDRYRTSVPASRLVSGEKPLHGQLERALAEFI